MLPAGSKITSCRRGHEKSGDNLWIRPTDGKWYCKKCQKETRRSRYLTLDELTGRPFCKKGEHVMLPENVRGKGRTRECISCLFEDDLLYDSELGMPLYLESEKRLLWADLMMVDFS